MSRAERYNNGAHKPRRTRGIVYWYHREGKSMRWVAKRYGVSVERIRQILKTQAPELIRPVGRRMA